MVTAEKLQGRITPKKATPFSMDMLIQLSLFLAGCRGEEMGVDDGETLHGFRSGCTITLALSGIELSEIMDRVGWNRRHAALHYLQLEKVLKALLERPQSWRLAR